ncbi:633_t:CDS:2, partial [Scutellospora calospora]
MQSNKINPTELSKLIHISRQKGCVDTLVHLETKTNLINLINDFNDDGITLDSIQFEYFKRYNRVLTYSEELRIEDLMKHMTGIFHVTKIGSELIVLKIKPEVRCMLGIEMHNNQEPKERYSHFSHLPLLYEQKKDYQYYQKSHE